jgi:hypothetical protein
VTLIGLVGGATVSVFLFAGFVLLCLKRRADRHIEKMVADEKLTGNNTMGGTLMTDQTLLTKTDGGGFDMESLAMKGQDLLGPSASYSDCTYSPLQLSSLFFAHTSTATWLCASQY